MKTELNSPRSLDDLVFENRNHEYGAYAIRKAYYDNVNKGAMLAVGVAVIITIVSILPKQMVPKLTTATIDPTIELGDYSVQPILPPPPPPTQTSAPAFARKDIAPVAVVHEVPVDLPPVDENTVGSTQGVEGGDPNAIPTEGEIPTEIGPSFLVEEKIFDHSEVMPEYVGGLEAMMKFIVKNVKYPSRPRRMGLEGTVYVSFIIGKDGAVLDPKLVKGFDADCDNEAIKVLTKMAKWNPGLQSGVPVKVRMVIPIKFRLNT